MKKYTKPTLVIYSDKELQDLIFAGASCPNCYQCGTYTSNGKC